MVVVVLKGKRKETKKERERGGSCQECNLAILSMVGVPTNQQTIGKVHTNTNSVASFKCIIVTPTIIAATTRPLEGLRVGSRNVYDTKERASDRSIEHILICFTNR
mmetsp:Transcript_29588/g.71520  ORF Transcript_29588/g.71520 Transcript_29588/m.71520 type:complete len:106 (+) Transcript_29588:941-1258(+)